MRRGLLLSLVVIASGSAVLGLALTWSGEDRRLLPRDVPEARAVLIAARAFDCIRAWRVAHVGPLDPVLDPRGTGLIGTLVSPVSSSVGHLDAKQATADPRWAGVVTRLLRTAGARRGDAVAVGLSGSFPALNIATLAAAEALGLKAVAISSASASNFGANLPELTWLDMERLLAQARILGTRSAGVTLGGTDDRALSVGQEGRQALQRAVERSGLLFLDPLTLADSVDQRMGAYRLGAGMRRIAAYLNVGGNAASVGEGPAKRLFAPGLTVRASAEAQTADSVMGRFAKEGVPIIHLSGIHTLAQANGLPWPHPASDPGGPVLVVTSPTVPVLKRLVSLVQSAIVRVPGLRLRGVFPESLAPRFEASRKWLRRGEIRWVTLESIPCSVPRGTERRANPCSPHFRRLFAQSDGVLFPGGKDLPPGLYGEARAPETDPGAMARHRFELSFLRHLLGPEPLLQGRPDYVVMGVCLGMQTMNVALGGTLIQDVPREVYGVDSGAGLETLPPESWHRSPESRRGRRGRWTVHPVTLGDAWHLGPRPGAQVSVMSSHHQAIETLGDGLRISATSVDGKVIEAVAHVRFPHVAGLQFHAESRQWWRSRWFAESGVRRGARGRALRIDPASVHFHERLWAVFSQWLQASRRHRGVPPAPVAGAAP